MDNTESTAGTDNLGNTAYDAGSPGSVPDGTSHSAVPAGTSRSAVPDGTSHSAVPDGTSHSAVPDGTSHSAVPDGTSRSDNSGSGAAGGGLDQAGWDKLQAAATAAMGNAYVPYSKYPVGAAALLDDGRVVSGCNVENASYGLTLCAECTMVGALQMGGGGRIRAFYCVDAAGAVLMPCGRCRQLLYEFRAPGMVLMTSHGVRTMDQVLPDAFGPENLENQS